VPSGVDRVPVGICAKGERHTRITTGRYNEDNKYTHSLKKKKTQLEAENAELQKLTNVLKAELAGQSNIEALPGAREGRMHRGTEGHRYGR